MPPSEVPDGKGAFLTVDRAALVSANFFANSSLLTGAVVALAPKVLEAVEGVVAENVDGLAAVVAAVAVEEKVVGLGAVAAEDADGAVVPNEEGRAAVAESV